MSPGAVVLSRGQVATSSSLSAVRLTSLSVSSLRARAPTLSLRAESLRVLRRAARTHWSWPLIRTVRTLLVPRLSRGLICTVQTDVMSSVILISSILITVPKTALKTECLVWVLDSPRWAKRPTGWRLP